MPTLQDLRRKSFSTIKAFADVAGISQSLAGQWLRGRDDIDPRPLYALLGIGKDEYLEAWQSTKAEEEARWKAKHPMSLSACAVHADNRKDKDNKDHGDYQRK